MILMFNGQKIWFVIITKFRDPRTDWTTDRSLLVDLTLFRRQTGFGPWIPDKDEEIAVVAHNDPHAGNMMMDRNDTTGQSLILIDWDLCQYGYRVFDLAYYMFYGSFVHVAPFIGNEDFDYDDPGQGSSDVN